MRLDPSVISAAAEQNTLTSLPASNTTAYASSDAAKRPRALAAPARAPRLQGLQGLQQRRERYADVAINNEPRLHQGRRPARVGHTAERKTGQPNPGHEEICGHAKPCEQTESRPERAGQNQGGVSGPDQRKDMQARFR